MKENIFLEDSKADKKMIQEIKNKIPKDKGGKLSVKIIPKQNTKKVNIKRS
jgi:hypothetical protein